MAFPTRSYGARRHTGLGQYAGWLPDLLAAAVSSVAALVLSWPLLTARDLDTGAGDWPAHAFRVREVLDNGLTSWSHSWAGGMPLWEGYQAVPHLLTAALVATTGLGITQAMVLLAGLLLIVLRVGTYVAARLLGAPPAAALVGSLLVCLLDTARQPTANYSELWGLAFSPLLLAAGYRSSGRPAGLVVAAVGGASIEVHPHLAVIALIGLFAGYCCSPLRRSIKLLILQAALFTLGAAVFWLPVLTSARPAYTEPYFVSPEFARLLLSLATAGFIPGWPFIAAVATLSGLLALRRMQDVSAIRFCLLCGLAVALLLSVSLLERSPELLRSAQLSRIVAIVPVLIGLLTAAILGRIASRSHAAAPIYAAALALFSLAMLRPYPLPAADTVVSDRYPAVQMLSMLAGGSGGRVLADPVLTAHASFAVDDSVRYAGSYSGREWSILTGPTQFSMEGNGDPVKRAAYLVALGVEYAVVPAGSRPPIADPASGEPVKWEHIASADGFDLLRTPWTPASAWHLATADRAELFLPDLAFRSSESAYIRDTIVGRLAAASMSSDIGRGEVQYPGGDAIIVTLSGLDGRRYLVVNENWDRTWAATANGQLLPIERIGAHQIGVDLAGLTGEATIVLRHTWPVTQIMGLLITIGSLVVASGLWMARGWNLKGERR